MGKIYSEFIRTDRDDRIFRYLNCDDNADIWYEVMAEENVDTGYGSADYNETVTLLRRHINSSDSSLSHYIAVFDCAGDEPEVIREIPPCTALKDIDVDELTAKETYSIIRSDEYHEDIDIAEHMCHLAGMDDEWEEVCMGDELELVEAAAFELGLY